MRHTRVFMIAAALFAVPLLASAADRYLWPQVYYYADRTLVRATGGSPVVSPADAILALNRATNYTFTAVPPAGRKTDGWRLAAQSAITSTPLDNLKSLDEYEGDTVTVTWRSGYPNSSETIYYLMPCFSWINWRLAYRGNDSGVAGDYGMTDLIYTNTVTIADASTLWDYTRTGYDIAGWSLSPTGQVQFTVGETVERAGEEFGVETDGELVYLYAVWQKRAMQIFLDAQGGVVSSNSITVYIGDRYQLPTPVREGFDFRNWSLLPSGGTTISDGALVARDDISRLYAQWDLISYRLAYDWNWSGADTAPTSLEYGYTNTVRLVSSPTTWHRAGYNFLGWSRSPNTPTAMFAPGSTLASAGSQFGVTSSTQTHSVTLYGIWEKREMPIELDAQGGIVSTNSIAVYISDRYTLPIPMRDGFIFEGWFTSPEGGTQISTGDKVTRDDISKLYAHWRLIEFTLEYKENESSAARKREFEFGWTNNVAILSLPENWVRPGWDFLGWMQDPTSDEPELLPGQTISRIGLFFDISDGDTITLYPVYERHKMVIALDPQGGVSPVSNIVAYVDSTYENLPEDLTLFDKWFLGWWTKQSGGEMITNGQTVVRTDIPILYAHWKDKERYNVSFYYHDASGTVTNVSQTVFEKDPATAPSDDVVNVWTGHTFCGWTPSDDWSSVVTNIDYTAIYTTNEYDVAFYANGGQGIMDPMHFIYGEEQNLYANTFTRGKTEAWAFVGWSLDENAGSVDFTNEQAVVNLSAESNATVELHAVWDDRRTEYSTNISTDVVLLPDNESLWITTNLVDSSSSEDVDVPAIAMASVSSSGSETKLTGRVLGTGVLSYQWKASFKSSSGSGGLGGGKIYEYKFKVNDTTECQEAMQSTEWRTVNIPITNVGWSEIEWSVPPLGINKYFYLREVKWVPDGQCFVSFDGNGGEGTMMDVVFYDGEYGTLPRNVFTLAGYTFAGWKDDEDKIYSDRECTDAFATDTTLYAQWQANEYFIHFGANGGEGNMIDQLLTYDTEERLNANVFTRQGYSFVSWLFGNDEYPDCVAVSNLTTVAGDILDFTAQWRANEYFVRYEANGGEGEAGAPQPFIYDLPQALASNRFTRTGYAFAGWSFNNDVYEDCATVSNLTHVAGGEVSLLATWTPVQYNVEFVAPDAAGTMSAISLTYDNTGNLPPSTFTRTGYTFDGWMLDGVKIADGAEVVNLADRAGATVRLIASWRANSYTLTFNANGGVGGMDDATLTYDASTQIAQNSFSRLGYVFEGWATSADGAVAYVDGADVVNLASLQGASVSLYAVWSPISYSIRFAANGANGTMADLEMTYDVSANLPSCSFSIDGANFDCWKFNGAEYSDGARVINLSSVDGDVVVFEAQWIEDEVVIPDEPTIEPSPGPVQTEDDEEPLPEVFEDGAEAIGEFTASASATYNGWLRDTQTGRIVALITVKTSAVRKVGAVAHSTIKVIPFSGKSATYKTTVAPGGNPVDKYGIVYGNLGLSGYFQGNAVEASLDFSKAKSKTPERELVSSMPIGTWNCAFADGDRLALFSVAVSKNGKAKVSGILPGGKKVSVSAQGILGSDFVFAIPVMNAKKGVGFVLWISQDGSASATDCAKQSWSPLAAGKFDSLPDGHYHLGFDMPLWRNYIQLTDIDQVDVTPSDYGVFAIVKGKWKPAKTVGKIVLDKSSPARTYVKISAKQTPANLSALNMKCAAKTGIVSGSFRLWYVMNKKIKSDKATIYGILIGDELFGFATIKTFGSFAIQMVQDE